MSHVLVLAGGTSGEREVSLRSGKAVAAALQTAGHEVEIRDPADGLDKLWPLLATINVVFPALHGLGGEDGTIQAWLEAHQVPFVGAGSVASQLCFDKAAYKKFLQTHNLPTPPGHIVDIDHIWADDLTREPFVLKPVDGGSSIDTFIVREPALAPRQDIEQALRMHTVMLLEKLITGTELTVAILKNQVLPVIEIVPPKDGEFDYENKYNGQTSEICPPEHITSEVQRSAQDLAFRIHQLSGCRDMSRTDMIVDDRQQLWVLETNTIPGLTDQSLLPKAAAAAGIDMPQLVDSLIKPDEPI